MPVCNMLHPVLLPVIQPLPHEAPTPDPRLVWLGEASQSYVTRQPVFCRLHRTREPMSMPPLRITSQPVTWSNVSPIFLSHID